MPEVPVTEVTESFASIVVKESVKAVAIQAASIALALTTFAVIGKVMQVNDNRKAKKALTTEA